MRLILTLWTLISLFLCVGPVHAQHIVHGHVIDALTHTAIASASVILPSSGIGTTTDVDGHFELTLPKGDHELRISFVGYAPVEIIVSSESTSLDHLVISLTPTVIAVDEIVVQGSTPRINDPAATSHHLKSTEDLLDRVPGADFVQRANFAWQPVIRGLSGGQVGLVIDGIKVVGACVDMMDPINSYVEVENLKKLELTKGGFDLTQSSQIGGTINLITQKPHFDQSFYGNAEMNYSSAAQLRQGRISGGGAHGSTSFRGSYSYKEADDFSPGGRGLIQGSGFKKNNYTLSLSQRIGQQHQITTSFLGDNSWDVGYPVLLMDAALAKAKIFSLTHIWKPRLGLISQWETKLYTNRVDHWMSDYERNVRERAVMRAMYMPMYGKTRTTGGLSTLQLAHGAHRLQITLDAYQTKSFGDMWMFSVFENIPDMYLLNLGDVRVRHGALALEFTTLLRPGLTARMDLRIDYSPREVLREEAIAILQDHAGVSTLTKSYTLAGASLSFTQAIGSVNLLRLSLANVGRLPTHIENYGHYVYNYVDGYFYIGNPELKPERSMQAELGFERWSSSLVLRASVFGNYIRHHILGQNEGDFLGNATLRFRRYQNGSSAFLIGGEVSAVVDIHKLFEWTASASYTYGQNLDLDEPLYLIPPLTGWSSLRILRDRWSSELEVRMAMPQNRVARKLTDEDGTDGYFVANIRGSIRLFSNMELTGGVSNLFDVYYHTHLSYGNLPSLGRDIYLTLSYSL